MTENDSQPLDPALTRRARRRGVILVVLAAASFSISAAFAKTIGTGIPVAEVIFFRNFFALIPLLPVVISAGGLAALRMRNPGSHMLRTIFGMMGMVGSFYGYVHLPLVTVTALGFTMPLFLTLLAIPILGEKVGWRRWLAVLVGFCGVMLMVRPEQGTTDTQWLALGLCILGALAWALAMITIRKMGKAGESGVAIVFWFAFFSSVLAGIAMIPVWVWPSPVQWALLAGIGLVSAIAQIMMTDAYRKGEASLLAPFEYSAIIWTTALGALIWAEMPDAWDFLGILVLVGAGLYIWYREMKLGVKR
jgi:drug/metabolite transporter (DMT)-like permease